MENCIIIFQQINLQDDDMLTFLLFFSCSEQTTAPSQQSSASSDLIPIRIGWQETWATQGQLAVILQEESILKDLGFDAEFVGFSYGAPLNEGALAGEVDVLFTADQPAIALCNRDKTWGMIGRLMYNRVGTFVPPESPIQQPSDLKGKTIAIPIGAAAHRETLAAVKMAGLDPTKDINPTNMGVQDIAVLAKSKKWDVVDAGSAWDPIFADLESSGLVRTIASGTVTSVIVMDDDLVNTHAKAAQLFLQAMDKAYQVYKKNTNQANQRFISASNLSFSPEALDLAASVEPNLQKDNPIRLTLTEEDKKNIQSAADFMFDAKILKAKVDTSSMLR